MKRVLITGGFGFVGGRLTRKLAQENEVIVSTRAIVNEAFLEAHGNPAVIEHHKLLSPESFPSNIDTVIHLAALNEIDCLLFPSEAIRVNIDETRMILDNAINSTVKQFIYFSTAHVYGTALKGQVDELTLTTPVHPYAITHKAAEDYVLAAGITKKIHAQVIRLSNSFGAPVVPTVNRWTLLANDLCRQAVEKGRLDLLSNGCQYRDFICLSDVESVIAGIVGNELVKLPNGIYNLGAGMPMQVITMARRIAACYEDLFNETIPVNLPANAVPTEETPYVFCIGKLQEAGFKVHNEVDMEIRELLKFCYENFSRNA